jgi:hypothetical protein
MGVALAAVTAVANSVPEACVADVGEGMTDGGCARLIHHSVSATAATTAPAPTITHREVDV